MQFQPFRIHLHVLQHVQHNNFIGQLCVLDNDHQIIYFDFIYGFSSYSEIYDSLVSCKHIRKYLINSFSNIEMHNPYFGCKSLEEMMIVHDLMDNEQDRGLKT